MWFIPITYTLTYDSKKLNENDILDLIEQYLQELKFAYINRENNIITYHKGAVLHTFSFRDFLGSGSIKVKSKNNQISVTFKHWIVFLILGLFVILFLLFTSRFSAFDESDKESITIIFLWLFGGNYLFKLSSHYMLKNNVHEIIIKNLLANSKVKNQKHVT